MDAERPTFSVIVPIAPGRTPLVLESLKHLGAGASHEVLAQVGPNPSRNRNERVERARASILAFTDDDCQVAPDWLARAAAFFAAHPEYDAVGGPQLNTASEGVLGRAAGYALASWFGTARTRRRFRRGGPRMAATQRDLTSANLFVTRRAFEAWGPFDERLWPNEETTLLARIEAAGGRIAYDPTIVVFHRRRDSLRALARQCFGYGRGRARQAHLEGGRLPDPEQAVPSLFLGYLALVPVLAPIWPAALLPLAAYAATAAAVALGTAAVTVDLPAALAMTLAFPAIHAGYAAGFVLESLRLRVDVARALPARAPVDGTAVTP